MRLSDPRALEGAGLAVAAAVLALGLYYIAGRSIGHLGALALFWLGSLVPLYVLTLLATIVVATFTQCPPATSDCPVG